VPSCPPCPTCHLACGAPDACPSCSLQCPAMTPCAGAAPVSCPAAAPCRACGCPARAPCAVSAPSPGSAAPDAAPASAAGSVVADAVVDARALASALVGGAVGFVFAAVCLWGCCAVLRRGARPCCRGFAGLDDGGSREDAMGVRFLGRVALAEADRVIYAADGDLCMVAPANDPDVQAARFGSLDPPPPGIAANQVYRFRAEPTGAELAQLTLEAEQVASGECRRRAQAVGNLGLLTYLRPLVTPVGGLAVVPVAPAGPASGLLRGAVPAGGGPAAGDPAGAWRAAACEVGYRVGDEVPGHIPTAARIQDRDIHVLPDGQGLFAELVPPAALESFLRKAVDADARALPIVRDAQGRRDAPWNKMVEMVRQEDFGSDWVLPGPRDAVWRMSYLQREGLGIEGHRERFRQICKLGATDWGVQEHCQLCQQIKAATCQDLQGGTNLISIEMKFRRLHTMDKGVGGKMSLEEQAAFSGISRSTSSVMVSPDLIERVCGDDVRDFEGHRPRDIFPLPCPPAAEPLDKAAAAALAR
ncbi:unnamed protein product, partial [Prorocentrum cordatum]